MYYINKYKHWKGGDLRWPVTGHGGGVMSFESKDDAEAYLSMCGYSPDVKYKDAEKRETFTFRIEK